MCTSTCSSTVLKRAKQNHNANRFRQPFFVSVWNYSLGRLLEIDESSDDGTEPET